MTVEAVEIHRGSGGSRIYRIPLELFPGFSGYAHLALHQGGTTLIDVGSGFGDCTRQLEAGLDHIREEYGEPAGWKDIDQILITHGHIDHFGGLPSVRERCAAPVSIHEMDRKVLTGYEERLTIAAGRLEMFLKGAGLNQEDLEGVMNLYMLNKDLFRSMEVEHTFYGSESETGPFTVVHTPGHTPGQVVILLEDILFSGDHILSRISPHLAPEILTLHTGLGHYLDSLQAMYPLADRAKVTLGGHREPIYNLRRRIDEITVLYQDRLNQVMEELQTPMVVRELSDVLFPEAEGYHYLLALEETGAYVEYLMQRDRITVVNGKDLELNRSAALRYRRRERAEPEPIRFERIQRESRPEFPAAVKPGAERGRRSMTGGQGGRDV